MPVPISAIAGGLQAVSGAINYFSGKKQQKAGEELYDDQLGLLRSGKKNLKLAKGQTDAANLARQYGETIARSAQDRAQSLATSNIMAARGGDPRMAAALNPTMAASDQAIQDAQMKGFGMSITADQNLADVEQSLLTENDQFQRALEAEEMARGGAAAEAGRQQKYTGISQAFQSPITGAAVEQQMPGSTFGFGQGFNVPSGEDGMKTPGPFDHDSNPIHMVDDNGRKVGEATGGELIFNPDQTETIESLIEGGKAHMLMRFLKDLLNEPQFQESRTNKGGGFVHAGQAGVEFNILDLLKDLGKKDEEEDDSDVEGINKMSKPSIRRGMKKPRRKVRRRNRDNSVDLIAQNRDILGSLNSGEYV
jgi:hypothetical protein